jgi:hypothetical protein
MDVDPDANDREPDVRMPMPAETLDHARQEGVPFIERFPLGVAGTPISNMGRSTLGYEALRDNLGPDHIWYPFQSQRDWEFARWAKNRGPSSTAVSELLAIDGVSYLTA